MCNRSTFATSVSLVSFNPLRHARFNLRHAIVSFDVSVIVVHSLFHKLQSSDRRGPNCSLLNGGRKKKGAAAWLQESRPRR